MTKSTTVKRKANVGERILITNSSALSFYNGDIFTVREIEDDYFVKAYKHDVPIYPHEYEVIIENAETPSQVSAALTAAHDAIDELRRKAYGEGFDAGRAFQREQWREKAESTHAELMRKLDEASPKETPQQIRDNTIERAKADVEKITEDGTFNLTFKYGDEQKLGGVLSEVGFEINREERLVTAVIRNHAFGNVIEKGFAICAPDDCFNVHIGKAISLRRALGLEVPTEYMNAPSPTEVRVGDVVKHEGWTTSKSVKPNGFVSISTIRIKTADFLVSRGQVRIIDDSREASE
ncbi:hypothetical protein [Bacillus sp. FSL K6-3431]|uniref:hypothetical protein n=1 Tax=Bacillus sp. FSL K6-3431 TaxID=2921500 RepID=UPI0030F5AC2E